MPTFNGAEYDPLIDDKRLNNQLARIKKLMLDGEWRTLSEIHNLTHYPESSISAQLRHLRKPKFGTYKVDRQPRGDRTKGLFEYRVLMPVRTSEQMRMAV